MSINLSSLVAVSHYREPRQHIFPSEGSLQWYIRRHRDALIACGALLMIAGRWQVNPEQFDTQVLSAGSAEARRQKAAA